MRQALTNLHGVAAAEVSFDEARAIVRFQPDLVDVENMVRAVQEIGFQARVVEDAGDPDVVPKSTDHP